MGSSWTARCFKSTRHTSAPEQRLSLPSSLSRIVRRAASRSPAVPSVAGSARKREAGGEREPVARLRGRAAGEQVNTAQQAALAFDHPYTRSEPPTNKGKSAGIQVLKNKLAPPHWRAAELGRGTGTFGASSELLLPPAQWRGAASSAMGGRKTKRSLRSRRSKQLLQTLSGEKQC